MSDLMFNLGGGLAGLPIDASKARVREFFGAGHQDFRRSPTDLPSDYWPSLGVFAYYSAVAELEALEFAGPVTPSLSGMALNNLPRMVAVAKLREVDPDVNIESDGAISKVTGIAIWSATVDPTAPIISALTFRPGYYD